MMLGLLCTKLVAMAVALPIALGYYQNGNDPSTYTVAGSHPAYGIQYYSWGENFQSGQVQQAWNNGTETFIELQTNGPTPATLTDVTSGAYDAYLRVFAEDVAAFGHPVLITFDHEMNGNWYPWGYQNYTSDQWVAAWDRVTSVMAPLMPNATWVWAPNILRGARDFAPYWPGPGHYVGMVGLDGYYWDATYNWANTFQSSVVELLTNVANGYPFIIPETGIAASDTNWSAQLQDLAQNAQNFNTQALFYFDKYQFLLSPSQEQQLAGVLAQHAYIGHWKGRKGNS